MQNMKIIVQFLQELENKIISQFLGALYLNLLHFVVNSRVLLDRGYFIDVFNIPRYFQI